MSSAPALDTGQAVRFLQNLQQQKTGTVFTNLLSSLTNPGSEEELLLPLRQLLLKHIISTYPPKVAIGHGQLSNEVFSPGKSHRRNHPHNLASTPLTACTETTYAVRPSRSGHRCSSSSSPPPPGGQKLFSIRKHSSH